MTRLDDAVDALAAADVQAIRYEVKNLRAIKTWAIEHLGLDYAPGDRVAIVSPKPASIGRGWHPYREALAPGQTGIAGEIAFNELYGYWYVEVGMDRAWSVSGLDDARYWHGPADETPAGFEPPSDYDQKRHPNGRVEVFALRVEWVANAQPIGLGEAS